MKNFLQIVVVFVVALAAGGLNFFYGVASMDRLKDAPVPLTFYLVAGLLFSLLGAASCFVLSKIEPKAWKVHLCSIPIASIVLPIYLIKASPFMGMMPSPFLIVVAVSLGAILVVNVRTRNLSK